MPRPTTNPATKSGLWKKLLLGFTGVIVLLVIVALLFGRTWLNNYLQSAAFREKMSEQAGLKLRSKVELQPMSLKGTRIFTPGFEALGAQDAKFSSLKLEDIRADFDFSWGKLLRKKIDIDEVEIQKLTLNFTGDRLQLELPPYIEKEKRARISSVTVRDTTINWPGGSLYGVETGAKPDGEGDDWWIEAHKGTLKYQDFPTADLRALRAKYRDHATYLQNAELAIGNGTINFTGEFLPDERNLLDAKILNIDVTPFLLEDWRACFHGKANGDVKIEIPKSNGVSDPAIISGTVSIQNGVLEALPILDKIALFTRTDQFRKINLSKMSADFRKDKNGTKISHLHIQAERLISIRGECMLFNDQIDGSFEIGINPSTLQWLPGSQEKVFNVNRDGYAWTTMKVNGPMKHPKEDLTSRLAMAAAGVAIDKAAEIPGQAVDAAKNAVGSGLDLLFGK